MANIKITDLTAYTDPATTDVLPIVDVGADVTKKVSVGEIVSKITGDVEVDSAGASSIAAGVIVNADVNASAAIAGTKISPDFGSQAIATTGLISANGKVSFPLGTAAAPSLYPGSDTNTGIYSPGADQVAISTNGTGRLIVDAIGEITVPGALGNFTISGNGAEVFFSRNDNNNLLANGGTNAVLTTGANNAFVVHTGSTLTERLRITSTGTLMHLGAGNSTTPAVQFNGSAPVNSLVMDSSGRVGLGTSSPQTLFELAANNATGGNNTLRFNDTDTTTQLNQQVGAIEFFSNDTVGGSGVIGKIECYSGGTSGNGIIGIKTGYGTTLDTRLTIDHLGNVGIGTTSPTEALDVNGNVSISGGTRTLSGVSAINRGSSTEQMRIWAGGAQMGGEIRLNGGDAGAPTPGAIQFYTGLTGANSEKARIDSSGRLLVGTSSAATGTLAQYSKLQILGNTSSSASGAQLNLGRNETSTNVGDGELLGRIYFTDNQAGEYAFIQAEADGTPAVGDYPGALVFSVTADSAASPTEALRISSNRAITVSDGGNVVLGTTTGTKIGTATTQKLGFYNATPVVQPAAVADATDAATVITQLNDLLAKLRTLGLIAT